MKRTMYASIALTAPLTYTHRMASTVITQTVRPITLVTASQFPLSQTLSLSRRSYSVSVQHHRVKVWDKVPNFFVTQKPNWGARVTLLPVHRYYRIAARFAAPNGLDTPKVATLERELSPVEDHIRDHYHLSQRQRAAEGIEPYCHVYFSLHINYVNQPVDKLVRRLNELRFHFTGDQLCLVVGRQFPNPSS